MSKRIFSPAGEKEVSRAIIQEFSSHLTDCVESDAVIVGGGPSGLIAGRELAKEGFKVVLIERNNYLGGGFWIGGYLMNKLTVRTPADKILDELNVPLKEFEKGLFVADAPHACSKLIASACEAGVKILNMTFLEDVVLRQENRVAGAVINWTPIQNVPKQIKCLDPISIESKVLIDASGHDAVACIKLQERGLLNTKGCGAMWIDTSEDLVVEYTQEVHPGLIAIGMAVSTMYGLPRMGPTFGAMLLSGLKGAELTKNILSCEKETVKTA
ncbi:MAG: thiazole biosynthesis protein [Candidatus Omnitrophica bacterium]|nr:thiazole biosynthesis protein [Candidatus Omnitrophota bacterium]